MKVVVEDTETQEIVDENFRGLAVDSEGSVWVFGNQYAVVLTNDTGDQFVSMSAWEAIRSNSFTPFNGSVTLSND